MTFKLPKLITLISLIMFNSLNFNSRAKGQNTPQFINQNVELGNVSWLRDYDEALSLSAKQDKPVFILFQEVPGCSTCQNYGAEVLSHPLMVEAIENLFVPLAIHNNKGDKDLEILKKYNEPTWNNPVVRIVNAAGTDIVPRHASKYSAEALYSTMYDALANTASAIPQYFIGLGVELGIKRTQPQEAYYSMHCFWSGEAALGAVPGVIDVESGFMSGKEVVKVKYLPGLVDKTKIDQAAANSGISTIDFNKNYRVADTDVHYYLRNSKYASLPLTGWQANKINAALGNRSNPNEFLSPTQIKWFNGGASVDSKNLWKEDFGKAWAKQVNAI